MYNQLVLNAVMIRNVVDHIRVLHELYQNAYPSKRNASAFWGPNLTRNMNGFRHYPTWYKTEPASANKGLPT